MKISAAEAVNLLVMITSGPAYTCSGSSSLATLICRFEVRVCTTGPVGMNNPVSKIASGKLPPPLRRRSMTTASTLSFLNDSRIRRTSRVQLLKSASPR